MQLLADRISEIRGKLDNPADRAVLLAAEQMVRAGMPVLRMCVDQLSPRGGYYKIHDAAKAVLTGSANPLT